MAGFPSANDPKNPLVTVNPTATDPAKSCDKNALGPVWIRDGDARISDVHSKLKTLIDEFAAVKSNFGSAPICSTPPTGGAEVCVTAKEDAHAKFRGAMAQFNQLAKDIAVRTTTACQTCQIVEDYKLLVALAKANGDELVHTDKVQRVKLNQIDEAMVKLADTNIARVRAFLAKQRDEGGIASIEVTTGMTTEKDAIVQGYYGVLNPADKSASPSKEILARPVPRNVNLAKQVAEYTCLGFDR